MSGIVSDNQGRSSGLVKSTTVAEYDDDKLQSNIALLGFKTAVNGSLAKYNLQDQIIDEYEDASGIDASASTNENLSSGVYNGTATSYSTPTRTVTNAETPIVDGDYTVYKWHSTGSYANDTTQEHEYLIVGGGASGGEQNAGGGGAGGVLAATGLSLTGGNTYTTTIGAGGASVGANTVGNAGGDSILSGTGISTLTAGGGGGGGGPGVANGVSGRATNGSGGGGGYNGGNGGAGNGTGGTGGDGAGSADPAYGAGGGGGAGGNGADGTSSSGGAGGVGVANDITGSSVYYGGGGGGAADNNQASCGAGGNGGGGTGDNNGSAGSAMNGTANTGGGGGGSHHLSNASGAGGSGIVILRVLTQVGTTTSGGDLTLQSTDTTAMAEPDYADMVILMENAEGTASINVDIKGYISKDSGSTFTEGTLVDEGTWGTNKKIYAFHDLDISAQSGTSMCYKITTHNQSNGSKETKIHATSIGWKA